MYGRRTTDVLTKMDLAKLADLYFIPAEGMTELTLIRRIQLAQDGRDCFATEAIRSCCYLECRWRSDCAQAVASQATGSDCESRIPEIHPEN